MKTILDAMIAKLPIPYRPNQKRLESLANSVPCGSN